MQGNEGLYHLWKGRLLVCTHNVVERWVRACAIRGSNSQLSTWESDSGDLYFQYLRKCLGKLHEHIAHAVLLIALFARHCGTFAGQTTLLHNALGPPLSSASSKLALFGLIKVPTLLVIGQEDRTVVGRNFVSEEVARILGNYPQLGKDAARDIPGSKLIELKRVGHIPHLEAREMFHQALLDFLKTTDQTNRISLVAHHGRTDRR